MQGFHLGPPTVGAARARPAAVGLLVAGLLLSLVGCSDGSHHAGEAVAPVTPPVATTPTTLILASREAGDNFLGLVHELPLSVAQPAGTFLKFEGTPWIDNIAFKGNSLVFNSADNKFYAVLNGAGADRLGVLISFDPATDKLVFLKSFKRRAWPAVTGVKGESLAFEDPNDFTVKPLISPDGKALLLRAVNGGVDNRGALWLVNIDPASANYLKDTLVYSFFDHEKAQGDYCDSLRNATGVSEMAWGQDGAGQAVVFMGVSGAAYDMGLTTNPTVPGTCGRKVIEGKDIEKIKGRMFALKPTDAADLSKPWAYALGYTPFDPFLRLGRQIHWDPKRQAIRWTTEERGGGILAFYSGGGTTSDLWFGLREECYGLDGLLPLNTAGDAVALCNGLNGSTSLPDVAPRLFKYTSNDLFSLQAHLGGWYADSKQFAGATSSLVSRRLFLNGGENSDLCAAGSFACKGSPSTLEELDPATGYFQRVLATGSAARIGNAFLGDPGVGGAAREPMADRYVVWFGSVVKGYSAVLNKLDRSNGQITTLPLDPKSGAHPVGSLLDLGNGQALGLMERAAPDARTPDQDYLKGTGGYAGGAGSDGSRRGYYFLDLKSRQVLRSVSQFSTIAAFSRERVRLDDGTVWDATLTDNGFRQFNRVDLGSGKMLESTAYKYEYSNFPQPPFALSGRGSAALYLPFWKRDADFVKGYTDMTLACLRPDAPKVIQHSDPIGPAQAGFGNAHRIVYGATYSAANKAMYLATAKVGDADQGTLFEVDKGVAEADLCKAGPVVNVLVSGLADVPSTRILALKNGTLVYGTANGKLMSVDVAGKKVTLVADLRVGTAATSQVRGFLAEAGDNLVAVVVHDQDAAGTNTARRLVSVDTSTGRQSSRDITPLVTENEPYPGVLRLN